ncbi:MAG: hypothetical protein KDE51_16535, partial [Anaerolineales bacterium]|nr:hypothetical protein [Anaerolineales bacterium]
MNKKLLYFLCCLSIPFLVQAVYAADFLPWASWYPVERGLAEGERAYNWWIRDTGDPFNEYYQGQSTWNYPGTPPYFPE